MRVTIKGQVTIPKYIRDELGIKPHSEVAFIKVARGDYHLVIVNKKNQGQSRFAALRGSATVKMTTKEIMALTRG